MRRTAIKVTFLVSMAVALSGQLLAQNEILCRAECNRQRIALTAKHACCPAIQAPKKAREQIAQNCRDCRQIAAVPPAIVETQATAKTEPQSVSTLDIPVRTAIIPQQAPARPFYDSAGPVIPSIPVRLQRFLI